MSKLISLLKKYKINRVNVEFIGNWVKYCKDYCLIDAFEYNNQAILVISGAGIVLDKDKIKSITYENGCVNIFSKTNEKIILKKC